jgi:hypothetical protein
MRAEPPPGLPHAWGRWQPEEVKYPRGLVLNARISGNYPI